MRRADLFGMHNSATFYRLQKVEVDIVNASNYEFVRSLTNTLKCNSPKYTSQQVSDAEQETMLSKYLIECSEVNYG